jgi:hypothetical protein
MKQTSKKEYDVLAVMKRIDGAYRPDSGVYKKVQKALLKLSHDELDGLEAMLRVLDIKRSCEGGK